MNIYKQEIQYKADPDLIDMLFKQIKSKDDQILLLKFELEKLGETTLPIMSITKEPTYINIPNITHTLKIAANISIDDDVFGNNLHVCARVFETTSHQSKSYSYYISHEIFNEVPLKTKEMMLLDMHRQLIHEIIETDKKEERINE